MKRIAIGLLVLASTPASASYLTYGDWDGLSETPRAMYIAGALDAFLDLSQNERASAHFYSCLGQAKLSNRQLSNNVRAFATANPQHQRYGAQYAMYHFLIQLCGRAPE